MRYFVRSPHAFADIRSIDTQPRAQRRACSRCSPRPTWKAIGNLSQHPPLAGRGGKKLIVPHRPALAGTTVRHIGEPVALVVARDAQSPPRTPPSWSPSIMRSARRQSTCARRCGEGAPQVWPEAPGNIAVDWPGLASDPEANAREVERVFASARTSRASPSCIKDHGRLDGAARRHRKL